MTYIDVFEYIGVAAFAVCGAMAGIDRGADIFGVLFVAVITAPVSYTHLTLPTICSV